MKDVPPLFNSKDGIKKMLIKNTLFFFVCSCILMNQTFLQGRSLYALERDRSMIFPLDILSASLPRSEFAIETGLLG